MKKIYSNKLLKRIAHKILGYSLNSACKEQGLSAIKSEIERIVPDLSRQYTSFDIKGDYLINKVRSLHAFQVTIVQEAVSFLTNDKAVSPTIVDIGDSSGTHLQYLQGLFSKKNIRAVSVNLDPIAVEKIRNKGLEAIQSRAELLHRHQDFNESADIFLSFETIEHLIDPIRFLKSMSSKSSCDYFVVTIPYLKRSRIGLHQIRTKDYVRPFNAETTHILELSPYDGILYLGLLVGRL